MRPSFIATRIAGVETVKFSHLTEPFIIRGDGRFFNLTKPSWDYEMPYFSRKAAAAEMLKEALLSL